MLFKRSILFLIKFYQKTVSPDHGIFSFWFKNGSTPLTTRGICRFSPTCSEYAYEAIEKFGVKKGLVLGIKRVLRCHPWNTGGYDPVEEVKN